MTIDDIHSFEDLEQFLQNFVNFGGDGTRYDFNGAFHLFLAIMENLAENHLDEDIDEHAESRPWFSEKQLLFLNKLERLK